MFVQAVRTSGGEGVSRELPFDPDDKCEECGNQPAWDFMGDILCAKCAGLTTDKTPTDSEGGETD